MRDRAQATHSGRGRGDQGLNISEKNINLLLTFKFSMY